MTVQPVISTDAPVLVTGATSYVAGRVVERLLQEGLTVHATVRDASNTARLGYLQAVADANPGTLRFFSADLLEPGSFADAMAGCRVVLHLASPFFMTVKDPQRDLIEPAVQGTENVLQQANATDSVERVVLTSSCAAVYGDSIDILDTPRGMLDEEVWNTSSSLAHNPYSYSKTLAEKKAWEIADAQDRWRLVVLNPPMILGPGLKVHEGTESLAVMRRFIDGSMAAGIPAIAMGIVDIRDVAEAHLRAAFVPDAEGRHIVASTGVFFQEIVDALKPEFSSLKLGSFAAPKLALFVVGPLFGLSWKFISRNVGYPWKADNTKSIERLGMSYRPMEETMRDFVRQIVDADAVKPKS